MAVGPHKIDFKTDEHAKVKKMDQSDAPAIFDGAEWTCFMEFKNVAGIIFDNKKNEAPKQTNPKTFSKNFSGLFRKI